MEKDFVNMMIFTKGKEVVYNNNIYIVNHVLLRNCGLMVALDGLPMPVDADHVYCEPTKLPLTRQ